MSVEINSKGTLIIESENISDIQVKYYSINAELLFSRQPFLKDNTDEFSYIKAMHTVEYNFSDKT